MEGQILLIIEFVKGSPLTQVILMVALTFFLLATWRWVRAVKRRRLQDRAIFASPILCAEEVFPYGYLQRPRGISYSPGMGTGYSHGFSSYRSYRP